MLRNSIVIIDCLRVYACGVTQEDADESLLVPEWRVGYIGKYVHVWFIGFGWVKRLVSICGTSWKIFVDKS